MFDTCHRRQKEGHHHGALLNPLLLCVHCSVSELKPFQSLAANRLMHLFLTQVSGKDHVRFQDSYGTILKVGSLALSLPCAYPQCPL